MTVSHSDSVTDPVAIVDASGRVSIPSSQHCDGDDPLDRLAMLMVAEKAISDELALEMGQSPIFDEMGGSAA